MNYFTIKNENLFPCLIGLGLFIYLVLRVFLMPVSVDEYTTVNVHSTMSWWDILVTGQPNIVWAPNNHVLNSLFIKLEVWLFGKKDWAIRLHILVAFVFCFYYGTKIIQRITSSKERQLLYLLILFFNPYLLDFFGLARGYAMSIAGFMGAFYYFMLYVDRQELRHPRYSILWLFIAVWSNFSAVYLVALMMILMFYEIHLHRKEINVRDHLLTVIISAVIIALVNIIPLMKTIMSGESFGGHTGLFQDGIVNYIHQFIHHNPYINRRAMWSTEWKYIEVAGIVFLLFYMILQITAFLTKANVNLVRMQKYTLFLVIGVATISKILFSFFDVPLPTARTELLFTIPFYMGVCVAFERIILSKRWIVVIPWMMAAVLVWHFSVSINFDNTIEWWQTGDAKRVVQYLKKDMEVSKPDHNLKIGIEAWQYPSLAFYTETQLKDAMTTYWTDLSGNDQYDYLFISSNLSDKVPAVYEPVKKFEHGILYKAKQ